MATIGDPLLDLGLLLAFYGDDRPARPAMPRVQAVTRIAGAPSRRELAERYARASGRSVQRLDYYMTLAFWKLAAIVEGAYAHHLAGRLDTPYARALEHDVPQLLEEAAGFAGLADADPALPATA
jgi:aminoglycoside phosphotransferase (APT) family kinase protein